MTNHVKIITALAVAVLVLNHPATFAEEEVATTAGGPTKTCEWSLSLDGVRPGDDLFWDKGTGGTLKYTVMQTPTRGFAFSAGVQKWDVNEDVAAGVDDLGGGYQLAYGFQLQGDASLIPVSAVGVLRHELSPGLHLALEAGLSYVIVNSKVKFVELGYLAQGNDLIAGEAYASDVDIENGLVAIFGADLRYRSNPSSKWTWFAGVGGQVDLSKGTVTYPYTPLSGAGEGESELKAILFRAGLASAF